MEASLSAVRETNFGYGHLAKIANFVREKSDYFAKPAKIAKKDEN